MNYKLLALSLFTIAAVTGQPAAAQSTQMSKIERLKGEAESETIGALAQFELGKAYYAGLDSAEKDPAEAYYWFSVCDYSVKQTESFQKSLGTMEETIFQYQQKYPNHKEPYAAGLFPMIYQQLKISCEDLVAVLSNELPQQTRMVADKKLAAWKKSHQPIQPPKLNTDFKKAFLSARLGAEVSSPNADPEGIRRLMDAGAINDAKTPLLVTAVKNKRKDIAILLIESGFIDNAKLQTAFSQALANGDTELTALLVEKGAQWNKENLSAGLRGAMIAGNEALVEDFLKRGAKLAKQEVLPPVILAELTKKGEKYPGIDKEALHSLASKIIEAKNATMLRRYIDLGGITDFGEKCCSRPLIHVVAEKGDGTAFDVLYTSGMNLNQKYQGDTPLKVAVRAKNLEVVKKLVEKGALKNEPNVQQRLGAAISYRDTAMIDYLTNHGLAFSNEQKAKLAACPIEEKTCPGGEKVYSGPPDCKFRFCKPVAPLKEIVEHAANGRSEEVIEALKQNDAVLKNSAIEKVLAAPGDYNPQVLLVLSEAMFHKWRDDEGIFWFLAADLRRRGDLSVCQYGKEKPNYGDKFFSKYMDEYKRREPKKVLNIVTKVQEWDAKTPYNYNFQTTRYHTQCIAPERWETTRSCNRASYYPPDMNTSWGEEWSDLKIDELTAEAEKGSAEAQYKLAQCLFIYPCRNPASETAQAFKNQAKNQKGGVVVKQLNKREEKQKLALYWYQKAIDQGYLPAMALMIENYHSGRVVEKNIEKAKEMALQLFKQGEPDSFRLMWLTLEDPKNRKSSIYAWGMVRQAAGVKLPNQPDHNDACNELGLTDEELAIARKKGEELIKTYLPMFNSTTK